MNSRNTAGENHYTYTDPENIYKKVFYRIKVRSISGQTTYSKIVQLLGTSQLFAFTSVVNPFNNSLDFDITSSKTGMPKAELINQLGNIVKRKSLDIREGSTHFNFENTASLAAGVYILKIQMGEAIILRKVVKQNY
jgi:hypothetical protein